MRFAMGLAAALLAVGAGWAADPLNTLTVRIENVGQRGGTLEVGVYDADGFAVDAAPRYARAVNPQPGVTLVTFVGVAQGTYAVKVVQDVNRNRAHDRLMLGATAEPVGYSGAGGGRGKPSFRAAAFAVTAGDNRIVVRLHE